MGKILRRCVESLTRIVVVQSKFLVVRTTIAMLVFFILLSCTIVGSILEVTLPYTHRRITKKSDMVNDKERFVCSACHTEWISSRERVAVWSKDDHVVIADDCPTCGKTCTIHRGEEWRRLS